MNLFFRNSEGYYDPTAGLALAHIMKEERIEREREEFKRKKAAQERKRLVGQLLKQVDNYRIDGAGFNQSILRSWTAPMKYKEKAAAWEEATNMNVQITTLGTSQEYNPWEALANAIILSAVKEYRGYTKRMNQITEQLRDTEHLPEKKRDMLLQRYKRYEEQQDELGDFFFSELYSKITKIDGYDLLDQLNQEVEH